jgi:adenylyl-sulfate kinase
VALHWHVLKYPRTFPDNTQGDQEARWSEELPPNPKISRGSGPASEIPTSVGNLYARSLFEHTQRTPAPNGLTVWLTGLSSAGKSTISEAVYRELSASGRRVEWLDGDVVRQHLSKGLGFTKQDRDENVRRIGFVAELLTRHGVIVLVSAISPYRATRDEVRRRIGNFLEVWVRAPLEVCEQRDLKGIYRRARLGELHGVTGLDDPYEPPLQPDIECCTDREAPQESAARVLAGIRDWLANREA